MLDLFAKRLAGSFRKLRQKGLSIILSQHDLHSLATCATESLSYNEVALSKKTIQQVFIFTPSTYLYQTTIGEPMTSHSKSFPHIFVWRCHFKFSN